jgi:hypothetical protein
MEEPSMTDDHQPTPRQLAYLRYLLGRSHAAGVPYLPVENLHRDAVSAWIEYLEPVAVARALMDELASHRQALQRPAYFVTPARSNLPSSYVPPFQPIPEAFDHPHSMDTYFTDDDLEVVYCTLCGQEW